MPGKVLLDLDGNRILRETAQLLGDEGDACCCLPPACGDCNGETPLAFRLTFHDIAVRDFCDDDLVGGIYHSSELLYVDADLDGLEVIVCWCGGCEWISAPLDLVHREYLGQFCATGTPLYDYRPQVRMLRSGGGTQIELRSNASLGHIFFSQTATDTCADSFSEDNTYTTLDAGGGNYRDGCLGTVDVEPIFAVEDGCPDNFPADYDAALAACSECLRIREYDGSAVLLYDTIVRLQVDATYGFGWFGTNGGLPVSIVPVCGKWRLSGRSFTGYADSSLCPPETAWLAILSAAGGTVSVTAVACESECPADCATCCDEYDATMGGSGDTTFDGFTFHCPKSGADDSCDYISIDLVGASFEIYCDALSQKWIASFGDSLGGEVHWSADPESGTNCAPLTGWTCTSNDFGSTAGVTLTVTRTTCP